MEIESYLTDVYGPRLTGSPNMKEAGDWAHEDDEGLGPGQRPSRKRGRSVAAGRTSGSPRSALTPRAYPLIAYPKAWTPGTNGPVTGDAVDRGHQRRKGLRRVQGKLRGKFVLAMPMRDVPAHFEAQGHRYTDAELADLTKQPPPAADADAVTSPRLRSSTARRRSSSSTRASRRCSTSAAATAARSSCRRRRACRATSRIPRSRRRSTLAIEHYGRDLANAREENSGHAADRCIDNKFFDADLNAFNIVARAAGHR